MNTIQIPYEHYASGIGSVVLDVPCNSEKDLRGIMATIDKHFSTKPPMDPRRWAAIVERSAVK